MEHTIVGRRLFQLVRKCLRVLKFHFFDPNESLFLLKRDGSLLILVMDTDVMTKLGFQCCL